MVIGIGLMTFTSLPNTLYSIVVFIGFTVLGIGLGIYATPSTDTAVDNVPDAKAGEAAGIYKMSSTLGGSFGLAISVAIYSAVEGTGNIATAASLGLIANVIFGVLALVSVVVTVPKGHVIKSIRADVNKSIKVEKAL